MDLASVRKPSSCGTSSILSRSLSRNAARTGALRGGWSVSMADHLPLKERKRASGHGCSAVLGGKRGARPRRLVRDSTGGLDIRWLLWQLNHDSDRTIPVDGGQGSAFT